MKPDDTAIIFDIQRFSLHDGPGIRTTIFFKGCSLRCIWCQNPESLHPLPEISFFQEKCKGCHNCIAVCPKNTIKRECPVSIDHSLCDNCGKCADICPNKALRIVGRQWSVDQLVSELLRDRDFFNESGGGVTFSGGEPMLHVPFLAKLSGRLKDQGIHIIVETAGHYKKEFINIISGLIDEVYFDLKHCNSNEHERLTGYGNGLIFENFYHMTENKFNIQPRMPVIHGYNDTEKNIKAMSGMLKNAGLSSIHCLPYNNLGNSKLDRLNTGRKYFKIHDNNPDIMNGVYELFKKEGINAKIYE